LLEPNSMTNLVEPIDGQHITINHPKHNKELFTTVIQRKRPKLKF
jgi:hypothetical protein